MPLVLRVDNLNILKWWVDASYEMQPDCLSHTGATMYLVWRLVAIMYKRKRLNPINSTEVELVREDGVPPEFLW